MTDPVVYLIGGAMVLIGALAGVKGTQRGKEVDSAVAITAEMRQWAAELRNAEHACRGELQQVRAEVDGLRDALAATRTELSSTRAEVHRLRLELGEQP